ncbi:helix-turn-helix domain-containing protein [Streptomyces sp. NPDC059851]|uniref:helix-turn-helix domain-containing protein n=1 Tax=Streptomyces sp. NPDC059851 TaxID=3346971 RepID=UPI00364E7E90
MGTGRQGRPQRPVDTTVPALAELARELRELRAAAGLTLDELSAATHWSKAALSAATTGRSLPRWELVKAWVLACEADANLDLWRARYDRARVQHQHTRTVAAAAADGTSGSGPAGTPGSTGPATPPAASGTRAAAPAPAPTPEPAPPAPPPGPLPSLLERDAWRTLAPDRRPWGVNAHPAPIPLRFTTVGPDFTDTDSDTTDLSGRYDQIAEVFALTRHRRLVILGDRGAGKTELARHLGTRLLTAGRGGGAVPVWVSLRGWRPEHGPDSLLAWIADALTRCTAEDVRTLLGRHLLLPVLDDFDALSPRQRAGALHLFNRLPEQAPFVLVSGWAEFARAVEQTDTVIAGSAAVRLRPAGVEDLRGWIQRSSRSRSRAKKQDWEPVLEALAARPDAPAVAVLADPMLACAARLLYTDGRADPAELIADDATTESLEVRLVQHLFGALPPYRHHPGRLHGRRRHAVLHLLAGREHEEGGPVDDLRVLYRGRRPSRRRAGIQAAVMGLLSFFLVAAADADAARHGPYESSDPDFGSASFLGMLIGLAWYGYLRHRLDRRASRADPVGRAGQLLVRVVPAGLVLLLAWAMNHLMEPSSVLLAVAAVPTWVAVWGAEQAVRRTDPLWLLGDLAFTLLFLLVYLVSMSPSATLFALLFLLPVLLSVTVTGYWVRAVFASRFVLWDLYPNLVHTLLHEATGPDILRVGPDGWSFTHPAVARWYRGAPGLQESDAGP